MNEVVDLDSRRGQGAKGGHGGKRHDPSPKCGAKTRDGGKCQKQKGWGTDHKGTGRCKLHGGSTQSGKRAAAKEAATIMGEAMDIEPHEALLSCVRIAAGEVAYCTTEIAALKKATESTMFGEKLNVWIEVRQGAVAQLARYSKMALDAGVAERQVQIAERYGQMLAELIGGILEELKLTAAQKDKAPEIVRRRMQMLEGGAKAA